MIFTRCPRCRVPHTISERAAGYNGLCELCQIQDARDRGLCYWSGGRLKKEDNEGGEV